MPQNNHNVDHCMRQCEKQMKRYNLSYDNVSTQEGVNNDYVVKIHGSKFYMLNRCCLFSAVSRAIKCFKTVKLKEVADGKDRQRNHRNV